MGAIVGLIIIIVAFAIMLGLGPALLRNTKLAFAKILGFLIVALITVSFVIQVIATINNWFRGLIGLPPTNDIPINLPNPAITYSVSVTPNSPLTIGQKVEIKSSSNYRLHYTYEVIDSTGKREQLKPTWFSSEKNCEWKPINTGEYVLKITGFDGNRFGPPQKFSYTVLKAGVTIPDNDGNTSNLHAEQWKNIFWCQLDYNTDEDIIPNSGGENIADKGCALTCAAMVVTFSGKRMSPRELKNSLGSDGFDSDGGIRWADVYGATNYAVMLSDSISYKKDKVIEELDKNKPVIIHLYKEDSKYGHWVVAVEHDGDQLYVNDPWIQKGWNIKKEDAMQGECPIDKMVILKR